MEDCCRAGLDVTMVQRSPTYVLPFAYITHPSGLGMYNILPVEVADSITMAGPLSVSAQLLQGMHAMQAMGEP